MEEKANAKQGATVRQVLDDVYEEVNWAYLAKNYFGKSRSWLYHKFSGRNGSASAYHQTIKITRTWIWKRIQPPARQ